MKSRLRLLASLLLLVPAALLAAGKSATNCGCACCQGKEVCCCHEGKTSDAKHYPLKGVIVEVRAAQGALMVKHEDIPGFMPAMTMLFKVDAAALKSAQPGQKIRATLVQRDGDFWLEEIKADAP